MQVGMLLAVLLTTAYAPLELLSGWLQTVARINPVTQVVEAARQGFVGCASPGRHLAGLSWRSSGWPRFSASSPSAACGG